MGGTLGFPALLSRLTFSLSRLLFYWGQGKWIEWEQEGIRSRALLTWLVASAFWPCRGLPLAVL